MTISLSKYHCVLREDVAIVSVYKEFSDELLEEIFDAIGNEPAVSPFTFIFIAVNNSRDIIAQVFVLANMKRYKVFIHENFIILIKRKK